MSNWIEFKTGVQPVPDGVKVTIKTAAAATATATSECFLWEIGGDESDIVAYKVEEKDMNNQDKPAFPISGLQQHEEFNGMSLRECAAIKLRVPDSGTDWLDAMIEKSLLNEFAGKALNGMLAHSTRYKPAYGYPHNWHAAISQEAFEIAEQMIYHSKGE